MHAASLFAAAANGRHDLYGFAHRSMRRAHFGMLAQLATAEFASDQSDLLYALRNHLRFVTDRLAGEEAHILPVLRQAHPESVDRLEREHHDLRGSAAMLEIAIRAVEGAADPITARANGRLLYLAVSRFVAEDLRHMADEESRVWPLLCERLDDSGLAELSTAALGDLDQVALIEVTLNGLLASNAADRSAWMQANEAVLQLLSDDSLATMNLDRLNPAERASLALLGVLGCGEHLVRHSP